MEWLVRLVFYPVAITLIAVAWHERQARADDHRAVVPVLPAGRPDQLSGATSQRHVMTGASRSGLLFGLEIPLRFTCVPRAGTVIATFHHQRATASGDTSVNGWLRLRHDAIDTTWPAGWHGLTDLRFEATRAWNGSWFGTTRANLAVTTTYGRHLRCRTGAVTFRLRGSGR